ncbi:scavenger receptor cysteine-rich type 1 protein M160-like [Centropristis striata]|uniref:scavenger receptor cysteine-rich type 1 protein M160-like n=1 Tax=Centropristis striata TaxID=184440 RepID=UPI0027DF94B7|nr:scavenger receptor cysteine-rich type 1 protein M160-like [Centropristis striata]
MKMWKKKTPFRNDSRRPLIDNNNDIQYGFQQPCTRFEPPVVQDPQEEQRLQSEGPIPLQELAELLHVALDDADTSNPNRQHLIQRSVHQHFPKPTSDVDQSLSQHLANVQQTVVGELLRVTPRLDCMELMGCLIDCYYRQTCGHLNDLLPNIHSAKDSFVLMKWVLCTYLSQEFLTHPDLQKIDPMKNVDLLLFLEVAAKVKDTLIENVKKQVNENLEQILQHERYDKDYDELHVDTIQCIHAKAKAAQEISPQLCDEVQEVCLQELMIFLNKYDEILGQKAQMDKPEMKYFFKTLRNCEKLKLYVQTKGESILLNEVMGILEKMEAFTLKLLMKIVADFSESHLRKYFKSDNREYLLLCDAVNTHFIELSDYKDTDIPKRVMGEAYRSITHIYLKHLIQSSQSKLKRCWNPNVAETVAEDAKLLHNISSHLAPSVGQWNLMLLKVTELLECNSIDSMKLIAAGMLRECQSEDLELLPEILQWKGLSKQGVREVLYTWKTADVTIRAESRQGERGTGRAMVYVDMDHLLVLVLMLWSSGSETVRLVGGDSRCAGTLELKHKGEWRPVSYSVWTLKTAAVACRELDCGSAVSVGMTEESSDRSVWRIRSECVQSRSALKECVIPIPVSSSFLDLTCSDSVRLVNGTSVCSGRLEVKSDQSNQSWSSVCEDDFDQQDAEVVCRELGCGAPSVLQGALYGEVEAPMWTKEFQCGGNESSLLDCRSSDSNRNTCSPGRAVGLTCSESVRLVGGDSRCAGTLEVKHEGEWRPVRDRYPPWTLTTAAVACRDLDCGSAVSVGERNESSERSVWTISSHCVQFGSALRECATSFSSSSFLDLTCSDSVRLVNGTSMCSGRLEVKSDQPNQSWSSVCEDDFDQQDAEVVCRELGCGAPSVLQGALYGEVEAPMWTKEFQCGENESALLDCRSSDSDRNTCSPGRAVGLTCSEPVRLVGGDSRCAGTLEVKHEGEWRPVRDDRHPPWTLKTAAVACRELDCGSAVSVGKRDESSERSVWMIRSDCVQPGSALRECAASDSSYSFLDLTCSDSVRLVNGTSLCSGRLEVKSDQSNQSWSSVCEDDFDQQDAEVVCRELGCGAPSVLQGALYGEVEAPMLTKAFQCNGNESALLDCRSSDSDRNTCSPGRAVGLTCSESVRLVGGDSRCAGTLEVKHEGEWRPVNDDYIAVWTLKTAAVACIELDCGSAVSLGEREESSERSVWRIRSDCVQSGSVLRECATSDSSSEFFLDLTCSDSVRLVNGTSVCSGRLEVKSDQSNQSWSSVCEDDFDQQDAEVVCRELGCGAPSVLQGALYGEVEAPMWTKEFQCGENESALLDCRSSDSDRNTCSPGRAVGLTCSEPVRLVGGDSRCAGTLEVKHEGEWRPVSDDRLPPWTLKTAAIACRELDCGSAVSVGEREESSERSVWEISSHCVQSGSVLRECATSDSSSFFLDLTCSDSVRLLNGTSMCSGRLEVKSDQSNQSWSSVCEDDFDQQDAEVVCRELGCGDPSVLQGALYGEVEAPMWTKKFQCVGNESSLLDCRSSDSDRNICLPGRAVGLTCSESVRLVGGDSRCAGTLEVKHGGEWRPVSDGPHPPWTLKTAAVACRELDCGSAVSVGEREESSERSVWKISSDCVQSGSALRECAASDSSPFLLDLTCSAYVRLVNGTTVCSGRLEVKSDQSNQSWSSVCEDDFDQQDAEVICRELGCGAPSVLQGALYGEVEAPMWTKEFQCGGNESSLLDCRSSDSDRNICSPGRAVGLTCSESVRLVGGDSRCAGTLEVKHEGEWRPVSDDRFPPWTLKTAAVVCRELDCGSAVSVGEREESSERSVWKISSDCVHSGSALRECAASFSSYSFLDLTCSDSVRLVNGTSMCSGRLEVKSDQSNQSWSSVCEDDFDQQDAEVVCRELGCGAPSVLQGALYGEVEAPMWTKEFQCGGDESSLLDCRSSDSDRNICSPGRAVGLTCSEPVKLVGGDSRCAGTLEVKHEGEWRPVSDDGVLSDWTLKTAAIVCRELDCGCAVSVGKREESSESSVWKISSYCVQSGSVLRECATSDSSSFFLDLTCSDLLLQPNISVSSSKNGVSEAQQQGLQVFRGSNFTISCSIQAQYPGGSFQLTFSSSNSAQNFTQPAVYHSAHFLFPAAEPAHQGSYSCVYHVHVFSHDFSSESRQLSLTVLDPRPFVIRAVVLPLILLLAIASYFYFKTYRVYRVQKPGRQENIELDYYNLGVPAADGGPTEEEGAQGAE